MDLATSHACTTLVGVGAEAGSCRPRCRLGGCAPGAPPLVRGRRAPAGQGCLAPSMGIGGGKVPALPPSRAPTALGATRNTNVTQDGAPGKAPRESFEFKKEQQRQWAESVKRVEEAGGLNERGVTRRGEVLDPPPSLRNVTIVLVGTKSGSSIGSVARSCNCFECFDLRLVEPRANPMQKRALAASCGATDVLANARTYPSLEECLADVSTSVAFTRWVAGREHSYRTITSLLEGTDAGLRGLEGEGRVALIFGREDAGLTEEEELACSACCAIPMGRLQESLSLGHAVTSVLARVFEEVAGADTAMESGARAEDMVGFGQDDARIRRGADRHLGGAGAAAAAAKFRLLEQKGQQG